MLYKISSDFIKTDYPSGYLYNLFKKTIKQIKGESAPAKLNFQGE